MPDYIPALQLPYGMAEKTADIRAHANDAIARGIQQMGQSIGNAIAQHYQNKWQAQQNAQNNMSPQQMQALGQFAAGKAQAGPGGMIQQSLPPGQSGPPMPLASFPRGITPAGQTYVENQQKMGSQKDVAQMKLDAAKELNIAPMPPGLASKVKTYFGYDTGVSDGEHTSAKQIQLWEKQVADKEKADAAAKAKMDQVKEAGKNKVATAKESEMAKEKAKEFFAKYQADLKSSDPQVKARAAEAVNKWRAANPLAAKFISPAPTAPATTGRPEVPPGRIYMKKGNEYHFVKREQQAEAEAQGFQEVQ